MSDNNNMDNLGEEIVFLSPRNARDLLGNALIGRDDNILVGIPQRVLDLLRRAEKCRDEIWSDCHLLASDGGAGDGVEVANNGVYKLTPAFLKGLSTVRTAKLKEPFIF